MPLRSSAVLAGQAGGRGDRRVPMVGRADRDQVDVLPLEQAAVVFVKVRLSAELRAGLLGDLPIDVADRHDVAVGQGFLGDDRPLVAHPHGPDPQPVVGGSRRGPFLGVRREDAGNGRAGDHGRGGAAQ